MKKTASDIIAKVAASHGVSRDDMKSPKRTDRLVKARIDAAKILYQSRGLTLGQIGVMLHRSWWQICYYVKDDFRIQRQTKMRWRKRLDKWKSTGGQLTTLNHRS